MDSRTATAFVGELEKIAFDWHKFREGVVDEGIPLGGATVGAALGARHGAGLRGAALGYAAGSGVSLAREHLKPKAERKPMPLSRKILAGSGLGYGVGGLAHGALSSATKGAAKGVLKKIRPAFHNERTFLHGLTEEGLPAVGATVGTGIAMGSHKGKDKA